MFVKRIPPASIRFANGAEITLSKRIGSAIIQLSIEDTLRRSKTLPLAPEIDPEPSVEAGHSNLDTADQIIASLRLTIAQLEASKSALQDNVVLSGDPSPASDAAIACRSILDALKLAEPTVETSDVDEVCVLLETARKALADDLDACLLRRSKLDAACRRLTLVAMIHPRANPGGLNSRYEVPKEHEAKFASPMVNVALVAKGILVEEARLAKIEKAQRRTEKRADVSNRMKSLWSDADA